MARLERDYLDEALACFSGQVAIDELYDGPYAVLSITDARTFRRLLCRVVGKKVTQAEIRLLLRDFRRELDLRKLTLAGVTTDGSALYPTPLSEIFGGVPHQLCRFHVLGTIAKAMRQVVVKLYKKQRDALPKLKDGRPRKAEDQAVVAQRQQLLELYHGRYDLVAHRLDEPQAQKLLKLLEGYPELAGLRELMQQVYGLYECPCTEAALTKLAEVRRFAGKLEQQAGLGAVLSSLLGPSIEKSLTYLDHPQMASTSNAVERSNRGHRKMQKSVYRVRTQRNLQRRLALDLLREQRAPDQKRCLSLLSESRGP
jgi:transposase-like protein